MKFLIDECLSPSLTGLAHRAGHGESSHVVWLKWNGLSDRALMPRIVSGDWTFVTRNAIDFRGPPHAPGSRGEYARVDLHAGLVCLNGPPAMDLAMQRELFETALDEVSRDSDLINQVLDVTLEDDSLLIRRYALPAA